ncbi:MAG TPA: lytic transglycosylase domain-containing protein [Candidatus Cybelea sp.]|jgi:soluble lytic murein transglycosylase-like protein|nr:lytic transglycosylase domain-containing protein [Candidatus Cybelea sp.]
MQIADELAAIQRRIAQIAVGPNADPVFGEIVAAKRYGAQALQTPARPDASPVEIGRIVAGAAQRNNLNPALIEAVIENESGFDARALSSAGAQGLMQLMPQTSASLGVTDPYDARQNVDGGARYLRSLLDRFGSVTLAVAAYNAGPNAVERFGGVPPYAQTRQYVARVLASFRSRSQNGNAPTTESSFAPDSIVP